MSCAAHSKNAIVFIKNASKPCTFTAHASLAVPDDRPPLGTVNNSLTEFTSGSDNTIINTNYRRSEAFAGACWLLTGNSELSLSEDHDQAEFASFNGPSSYSKGIPKYSGSINVTKISGDQRWETMRAGTWHPDSLQMEMNDQYPQYEIWVLEEPDRKDYYVSECALLTKYYGVVFDTFDKSFSGLMSYSIPFTAMEKEEIVNWENGKLGGGADCFIVETAVTAGVTYTWTDPVAPAIGYGVATFTTDGAYANLRTWSDVEADGTASAGSYSVKTNTRLYLSNSDAVNAVTVTVYGTDITGRSVEETITLAASGHTITSAHFYDAFTLRGDTIVGSPAGNTAVKIACVDHQLQTPYSSWGWEVPYI